MKKLYLIVLLSTILFPIETFASGDFGISTSSITIHPGETKTITISSDNAVGKLDVSSSNPSVASVSTGSVFIQTPGSTQTLTVSAKSVGNASISVVASSNFATMDEEILAGRTKKIYINVINQPEPSGGNSNNKYNNKPSNNSNHQSNNEDSKDEEDKSTNNKLKEISVDGFDLQKNSDNNYSLKVGKTIDSINISAIAEDSKATVTGAGVHKINVGKNNFEIIITSESGDKNKINVTIEREKEYYLKDLNKLLDGKDKVINIKMKNSDRLSSEQLSKLKSSKKKLIMSNDKYSIIVDGKKLKDFDEIYTKILFESKNKKKISKLSNYAEGIYLSFKQKTNFPNGVKLKIYVGDKYSDNDKVNVYYYDNGKLVLYKKGLVVNGNALTIPLDKNVDYFITMSEIGTTTAKKSNPLPLITSIIGIILLITLISLLIKRKKNSSSSDGGSSNSETKTQNSNNISSNQTIIDNQNNIQSSQSIINNTEEII